MALNSPWYKHKFMPNGKYETVPNAPPQYARSLNVPEPKFNRFDAILSLPIGNSNYKLQLWHEDFDKPECKDKFVSGDLVVSAKPGDERPAKERSYNLVQKVCDNGWQQLCVLSYLNPNREIPIPLVEPPPPVDPNAPPPDPNAPAAPAAPGAPAAAATPAKPGAPPAPGAKPAAPAPVAAPPPPPPSPPPPPPAAAPAPADPNAPPVDPNAPPVDPNAPPAVPLGPEFLPEVPLPLEEANVILSKPDWFGWWNIVCPENTFVDPRGKPNFEDDEDMFRRRFRPYWQPTDFVIRIPRGSAGFSLHRFHPQDRYDHGDLGLLFREWPVGSGGYHAILIQLSEYRYVTMEGKEKLGKTWMKIDHRFLEAPPPPPLPPPPPPTTLEGAPPADGAAAAPAPPADPAPVPAAPAPAAPAKA